MNEEKELLTITEFAEARGVSTQTIYQQIKKGLKEFVVVIDGKKYINRKAFEENPPSAKPKNQPTEQPTNQPTRNQVAQPREEFYQKQIEEKDKQIHALMEQLESAQTQNKELTEILRREQDLRMAQEIKQISAENPTEKRGFFALFKKKQK